MNTSDPLDVLFGGMAKLGPGGDDHTRDVLSLLPLRQPQVVVDAGCGSGRQTLVLARELAIPIHAVDLHEPFLHDLIRRSQEAGIEQLVHTHCMDMKDIPHVFSDIDLLWSEGAAYSIGFANALATWAAAMKPGGFVVVSELSWLREHAPLPVNDYFRSGYPDMQRVDRNMAVARKAGYHVLGTYELPTEAWTEGYYDVLKPRSATLAKHPDASVRELAAEMILEIEIFEQSAESYGYVFYLLQRI